MGPEKPTPVLEKLATSDKATMIVERQTKRKKISYSKRAMGDGRLHVPRNPDDGTPPIEHYYPYGLGPSVSANASDVSDYAGNRSRTVIDHAGPVSDHANPVIDH